MLQLSRRRLSVSSSSTTNSHFGGGESASTGVVNRWMLPRSASCSSSSFSVLFSTSASGSASSNCMGHLLQDATSPRCSRRGAFQNVGGSSGGAAPVGLAGASDKPFVCSVCNKAFRLQNSVEIHLKTVHPGTNGHVITMGGGAAAAAAPQQAQSQQQQQPPRAASAGAPVPPAQPGAAAAGATATGAATGGVRTSRLQQADPSRAAGTAFPTMAGGRVANPANSGSGGDDTLAPERYRRVVPRRERKASDPLHGDVHRVPDEVMNQLLAVWDQWGKKRLGDEFTASETITHAQVTKDELDEDVPTYVSMHEEAPGGEAAVNPFDVLADGQIPAVPAAAAAAAAAPVAAPVVDAPEKKAEEVKEETPSAAPAAAAEQPPTATSSSSSSVSTKRTQPADFADFLVARPRSECTDPSSPFLCPATENPFVTNPHPPAKPVILNQAAAAKQREQGGAGRAAAASAAAEKAEDGSGAGDGAEMGGGMLDGGDADDDAAPTSAAGKLDATPSAFAAVMQATSPFSLTESGAPLDSAFGTVSDPSTLVGQQPGGGGDGGTTFAAAAAAPSPFTQQPPQPPQQQQQQPNVMSPFVSGNVVSPDQQQQQQQQQQAPVAASADGAPLGPIQPAVDLSALFGPAGGDPLASQQQPAHPLFTCKVCGKNTFKTEGAMISHCQSKHGIEPSSSSATTAAEGKSGKKKPRVLPDLPPYIPSPVDLMATAPYSATRAGPNGSAASAATLMWSDVELTPHARVFSSATLIGEVTSMEAGFVQDAPCMQLTIFVAKTETTDEEEICVRCFGAEMVEHCKATLEVGCTALVEGRLRMNPSLNSEANRYYANPVVVVSSPAGCLQRL